MAVVLGMVIVVVGNASVLGRLRGDFVFRKNGFALIAPRDAMFLLSLLAKTLLSPALGYSGELRRNWKTASPALKPRRPSYP